MNAYVQKEQNGALTYRKHESFSIRIKCIFDFFDFENLPNNKTHSISYILLADEALAKP